MSDDRLTRALNGEDARLLDAAVRERVAAAVADIRLPRALRLTEWQRATVAGLISKVIRTVEDELRTILADSAPVRGNEALRAAFTSAHVSIAEPILERAGAHADAVLMAALIRRAEEHRRGRGTGEMGLLLELIGDPDDDISEQAMAILIAHSRRFDRFSDPVAARSELAAELEHRLVWRVAAALRLYMVDRHQVPPTESDEAVAGAASALLAQYDEGDSLEARAMRLARRLRDNGRLDDALLERTLSEGSLPLFLAAVAVRASLGQGSAWEVILDPRGRGAPLLLRAAAVARTSAASILLNLGGEEDEVARQLDLFDVTTPAAARDTLRLWQIDPAYREALAEIAA